MVTDAAFQLCLAGGERRDDARLRACADKADQLAVSRPSRQESTYGTMIKRFCAMGWVSRA